MIKQLLVYLCGLCLCAIAQDGFGQLSLGVKAGLNLNQFAQPGTTVGGSIGAVGIYQALPYVHVVLEPQYSQEGGAKNDYSRRYSEVSSDISSIAFLNPSVRFHNLQIPLLIQFTPPSMAENSVSPVITVGGSYGLMLSAFEQHTKRYYFQMEYNPALGYSDPADMDVAYERENVTDNYARNQWSLWFGIGLRFNEEKRPIVFDVRYRHGLNNLNQLRFASPGNGNDIGVPGTGGKLFATTVRFNLSMTLFNF